MLFVSLSIIGKFNSGVVLPATADCKCIVKKVYSQVSNSSLYMSEVIDLMFRKVCLQTLAIFYIL